MLLRSASGSRRVILEACYEMITMCKDDPGTEKFFGDSWEFDCDYLPYSFGDKALCFYKTCNLLPSSHGPEWNNVYST